MSVSFTFLCRIVLIWGPKYVADVGGFFGNPQPEMLVRWYWVGAFSPFFRAHAHLDSKRREPYLLDEPHKSTVRNILRLRYALLPVWYTAFHDTSVTGLPLLRYVHLSLNTLISPFTERRFAVPTM
jgi:alpha-glucosidase (family GH31 glycosyl hydrolase)